MSRTPIDDTIETEYRQVKVSRGLLPSILRRRPANIRSRDELETIEYSADPLDMPGQEPEAGGKPPYRLISFFLMVILPFVASVIYFAFIATDEYTAEARFAVRSMADSGGSSDGGSEGGSSGSGGGGLLSMAAATQDAYVVTSFINSSEVLSRIGKTIDYRAMFARSDADFLSRFDKGGSNEEFLKYWSNQVTSYIDGPSGIITLKVRTFSPQDSVTLATAILSESEGLINELSQRAKNDIIRGAQANVEKTAAAYNETLAALNQFQNQSGLLSPEMQAAQTGQLLTQLMAQKLDLESRQFVMKQSSAEESPAYQQMTLASQSLDQQIEKLREKLTGSQDQAISQFIVKYSVLDTNRMVAEKFYEAARNNYNTAVVEALRKALYVSVFVQPTLPEEALYPRRISSPLIILLGLIVLWSTLSLAWASVEDHRL